MSGFDKGVKGFCKGPKKGVRGLGLGASSIGFRSFGFWLLRGYMPN